MKDGGQSKLKYTKGQQNNQSNFTYRIIVRIRIFKNADLICMDGLSCKSSQNVHL